MTLGHRPGYFSPFWLRLEEKGDEIAEEHRRRDASRRRGHAARESAQEALLLHRLGDSLGQEIAETGEGDGGPRAAPLHQGLIEAQSSQDHAHDHIEHQDLGGGQLGLVDEHLSDKAEGPAAQEGPEIRQ